jgi:proteasome lid subunit RPN8/RPN11
MTHMTDFLKEQMKQHALEESPKEACGFVLEHNIIERAINISETPRDTFVIDPRVYLEAKRKGTLKAYYHSHPSTLAVPSEADKSIAERMQLPLYIYSIPQDEVTVYIPNGYSVPLEGRAFVLGIHDCVGLVYDYYRQKFGIEFPDIIRNVDGVFNGFKDLIPTAQANGFRLVESPKEHDIIVMKLGRSTHCNHLAIYLKDGNILHQLVSRTSQQSVYGGFWKRQTHVILRHSRF